MLARLLESRAEKKRSVWGTIFSAAAHTIVIAAAVFATAQARVPPPADAVVVHWTNPAPVRGTEAPVSRAAKPRTVKPVSPPTTPVTIPAIDVPALQIDDVPAVSIPVDHAAPSDATTDGAGGTPDPVASPGSERDDDALTAGEVDRSVSLVRGSRQPRYPEILRQRGIEGHVLATFVVNENGRVDTQTIRILRSDDPLFQASVVDALAAMRFVPAEVAGKRVRQLVQMPFVFTLSAKPGR